MSIKLKLLQAAAGSGGGGSSTWFLKENDSDQISFAAMVSTDSADNIYVTGAYGGGTYDQGLALKIDSTGSVLLSKSFSASPGTNVEFYGIYPSISAGSVALQGRMYDTTDTNSSYVAAFIQLDINTFATDWQDSKASTTANNGQRAVMDSSGNLYFTTPNYNNPTRLQCFLKYNSSGVEQWSKEYATGLNDIGVIGSDGTNIWGITRAGINYTILHKFDSSGAAQWAKYIQAGTQYNSYRMMQYMAIRPSDGYCMTQGVDADNNSTLLNMFDSSGNLIWSKLYVGTDGNGNEPGGIWYDPDSDLWYNIYASGSLKGVMAVDGTGAVSWANTYTMSAGSVGTRSSIAVNSTSVVLSTSEGIFSTPKDGSFTDTLDIFTVASDTITVSNTGYSASTYTGSWQNGTLVDATTTAVNNNLTTSFTLY